MPERLTPSTARSATRLVSESAAVLPTSPGSPDEELTPKETAYLPELVLAFVAPSGIDRNSVLTAVSERLSAYDYAMTEIHLSDWLANLAEVNQDWPPDQRIPALQATGDLVRRCSEHPEAMAQVAVLEITRLRRSLYEEANPNPAPRACEPCKHDHSNDIPPIDSRAYVIWSLKHEKEVELLRQVYRSRCFVFSVYVPEPDRVAALEQQILISRTGRSTTTPKEEAEKIVRRDEHEVMEEGDFGQDVRNAYPLADFFVDGTNRTRLETTIFRSVDIIFGAPFATPTKDEFGMYVAHAAALRSSELGRQVGASIATNLGDVVATGTNEVPLFGGGHYWTDPDNPTSNLDNREYKRGADTSDLTKRDIATQVVKALEESGNIRPNDDARYESVLRILASTRLADITEFGRAVHGEMSALMDAARRGVTAHGLTMYVTTFPCHQCSRHIVAAGLGRLVFIYPYAKSMASELHGDSIETPGSSKLDKPRIRYENYLGVAPRLYPSAFTMGVRKEKGVAKAEFDRSSIPRLPDEGPKGIWDVLDYLEREAKTIQVSTEWYRSLRNEVLQEIRKQGGQAWLKTGKRSTGGYKRRQPALFKAGLRGNRMRPKSQ